MQAEIRLGHGRPCRNLPAHRIYLTAHDVGARWLALAMAPWISVSGDCEEDMEDARQILLRRNDCCFQCAIDQAAAQRGRWFIIL